MKIHQLVRATAIVALQLNFNNHCQGSPIFALQRPEFGINHRQLSTICPVTTKPILDIMQEPLQFTSPSIRAFELPQYSIPQEQRLAQFQQEQASLSPIFKAKAGRPSEPLTPLEAPLEFISPSIRAFEINLRLRHGQQTTIPFAYGFSGYIKSEAFVDSYQVAGEDQDQFLFYPLHPALDRTGNNINAKGRFNMLTIESRLRAEIVGPFIFGANSFGITEVDAWATAPLQVGSHLATSSILQMGLLRIRHAFIYFEWEDKSLMLGQYWHPIILPECYADTISFNGGVPIEPFTRETQVRLTKQFGTMTFLLAAGSHANSPYDGPNGIDTLYTRNGIMPNINVQLFSSIRKHICGIGVDVTRLVPRLVTNKNFRANESLTSWTVIAFASFNWERLGLRLKFIYGQNGTTYSLISGYAVHSIDPYTDHRTYTNTQCLNAWLDTAYKGEIEPGLFLGISKNIGAPRSIIPSITDPKTGVTENLIYSYNQQDIDLLFRVQPRIRWFIKPLVLGLELELTGAKYGTVTDTARVINTQLVNNVRFLLAAFYVF